MIKHVLIPIDGSEHSKKALEFACNFADKKSATLHLLHVAQPPPGNRHLVLGAASITVPASQEELEKAGRRTTAAAEDIARGRGFDKVVIEVTGGDPAQRIIDYATERDMDMIVMGSRGLGDLSGLLMGSVSHKVNHLAPCTCVTVR